LNYRRAQSWPMSEVEGPVVSDDDIPDPQRAQLLADVAA
jgi:hypothetical protein